MPGHRPQHGFVIGYHSLAPAPPRQDRAAVQRLFRVRHHEALVKNHLLAQPMTHGTSARGCVERKMFRRQGLVAFACGRTEHAVGVKGFCPRGGVGGRGSRVEGWACLCAFDSRLPALDLMERQHYAFPPTQRRLHRIAQPHPHLVVNHEPVHDGFNCVRCLRVELDARVRVAQFDECAVRARPHKSLAR